MFGKLMLLNSLQILFKLVLMRLRLGHNRIARKLLIRIQLVILKLLTSFVTIGPWLG